MLQTKKASACKYCTADVSLMFTPRKQCKGGTSESLRDQRRTRKAREGDYVVQTGLRVARKSRDTSLQEKGKTLNLTRNWSSGINEDEIQKILGVNLKLLNPQEEQ